MRKWTVSIHGVRRQNVTKWKCVIVPKGGGRGIDTPKYSVSRAKFFPQNQLICGFITALQIQDTQENSTILKLSHI